MTINFNRRKLRVGTDFEVTSANITFTCTELAGKILESNLVTSTLDGDVWYVVCNHILWTVKDMISLEDFNRVIEL